MALRVPAGYRRGRAAIVCHSLPRGTRFPPRINISFRISLRCHSKTASLESSSSPSSRVQSPRARIPLMMTSQRTRCIPSDRHAFKLVSPGEKGRKTYVNLGDAQKGPREQGPHSAGLNMERRRKRTGECSRGRCLRFTCCGRREWGPRLQCNSPLPVKRITSW